MSSKKFPVCGGTLNDGSDCRTIVVDPQSDDSLEREYCRHHGDQIKATFPPAEPVEDVGPADEILRAVPDAAPDDAEPFASFSAPADSSRRGSPREELRKLAEASTEQLGRFFRDALNAEQKVWTDCPSCKKRSLVPVPAWAARTRAVELLLEQGFGKPDALPATDEERDTAEFDARIDKVLQEMSDDRLRELGPVTDVEREFLALPDEEQRTLVSLANDDVKEVFREWRIRRGYPVMPPYTPDEVIELRAAESRGERTARINERRAAREAAFTMDGDAAA